MLVSLTTIFPEIPEDDDGTTMKKQIIRLIVFGGTALGLAALIAAGESTAQSTSSPALLQPRAATHETRMESQEVIEFRNANKITSPMETVSSTSPTRSSFMATWPSVSGAKGYLLDVSTSNSFSSYVDGYQGLDVGNVNGRAVTGLNPGTTYYYRVRPYTAAEFGRVLECHHGYDGTCHGAGNYSSIRLHDHQ